MSTVCSPTAGYEALDCSDEDIVEAALQADPMAARGLLYYLTGDEEVADVGEHTIRVGFMTIAAVERPEDEELIRGRFIDLLKAYRDVGKAAVAGDPARLHRSLELTAGEKIPSSDVEMWTESLGLDRWVRGTEWSDPDGPSRSALEQFTVVVVGAGVGGLNAAAHLRRMGISFIVLERESDVGGVWHQNRYPGCRVDTPSRTYTHILGIEYPLKSTYCVREHNVEYLGWLADTTDVRRDIKFDTEATSLAWQDDENVWEVQATTPDGPCTIRANAVISAAGVFSTPNMPQIDGADDFRGTAVHTARWPDDLTVDGKRVAVIGTGCTGYQMFPEIVKTASHAYLFQRKPNWIFDTPGYLDDLSPLAAWLDRHAPYYRNFLRFRQTWLYRPSAVRAIYRADPEYAGPGPSALNDEIREQRIAFIKSKLGHRPELMEKMIPEAPPLSARPIKSDIKGGIYDALLEDNATLVSDQIARITEDAIVTADGVEHPVDLIVYATGFQTSRFLYPMDVRGRDGLPLDELWGVDGARAYVGSMIPGFPNLFMLYGPNTNPTGGLSVVDCEEIATRFALSCIAHLIEQDAQTIEVTYEAYRTYNDRLDELDVLGLYRDPRAQNYYTNSFGRGDVNNPFDGALMWGWLRDARRPHAWDDGSDEGSFISPHVGGDLTVR